MTREDALATAVQSINWGAELNWFQNPSAASCALLHAIACILLAREMRRVHIHVDDAEEGESV